MNIELLPPEVWLTHCILDNALLHGSLPECCNKHNTHKQLCEGHWDINFQTFCSVDISKQLRVCQAFWTYFTCKDHTYAYCKTGLCNFILYLIQTEHSQRNSAASEAVSPQFELWTCEQWSSDAAKINKFQFTALILEILSVQAIK